MIFDEFKRCQPSKVVFRKLGLSKYLEAAESWSSLRTLIVDFNSCDEGRFVSRVRECDGVASSGERVLLHAICFAVDFAWLADELSAGEAWRHMDRPNGEWRRAVAACIQAGT